MAKSEIILGNPYEGEENREINFMLRNIYNYTYSGKFNTSEFESFKILITSISHPSYPFVLEVSNDDSTYTRVKSWTAAQDYYEEIIDLVQGYQYFWLHGTYSGYGATFLVRAISNNVTKELNYKMRVCGDFTTNTNYQTKDYTKFTVKITNIGSTSYPPKLYASNSRQNWTLKKTWTAVTSGYEDITDLIKDYEYFYFMTSSTSYEGRLVFKVETI